jgi:cytoskeletal protein RodZ
MPEIGTTLREARMHARIDINEVEQATKIRAKYLRALENEEWSLLPGSTFVKSFLREYADYLGLDSRRLVEEYKLRYERPSETELHAISPNLSGERQRRGGRARGLGGSGGGGRGVPRWVFAAVVVLALLVALWAVGSLGGGNGGTTTPTSASTTTRKPTERRSPSTRRRAAPAVPTQASVRIVPTGQVYVCLVDGNGRRLIPGTVFQPNQTIPLQRSKTMRLTLGNNQVQVRVNGHAIGVPASSSAIAFSLTARGAKRLSASQAPTCT